MPKIIVASRYLKPAAKGTRCNLVKYIATRETVQKYSPKRKGAPVTENQKQLIMELLQINSNGKKLPEYSDYLKNPSKENASELLSELLEQSADMIADKEILVKYVAERPGVEKIGKHGLFSDSDDEIILSQAQKNIAEHQGNVWSHVISLTREDAERLGYTTPEMWRNLIMRHTDDIAKAQNIHLENLRWYAAFHNTTHHPHIHLLIYSTDIKEGFLTENGIEQIKSVFANDIFHNELYQVYEKQTAVRDQLRSEAENVMKNLLSELQNNNQFDPQLEQLILKLQSQLRSSKGKKVYGYLQPNVKKTVDQIVAELAKNPVLKKMYGEWCALEQQKYETYTSAIQKFPPLEENKVFKPIKNAVIRAVLEMEFSTEMFAEYGEDVFDETESDGELYIKWTAEYKSACTELTIANSDTKYSFSHFGNDEKLFVFEAPIDMLSFITLYQKDWQKHSYIAMNGVYESAVLKALENHSELKSVYLCTDNDAGGIEAAERLRDILHEHGYTDIFRIAPQLKDWNEQLKQLHGAEFLPAVPHKRRESYLQSIAELNEMKINPNRIAADLIAAYNSADRIRLTEFSLAASEHFLKIAGEEFPLDRMKKRLTNEYRCYQDKGTVATKLVKLQNAMTAGLEQLRKPSQTAAELKITARKLYDIADHALRLAAEETLVQRAEQKETSEETPSDEPQFLQAMSM